MNDNILLVAKGKSLLDKNLSDKIDSFKTVIRVNHIPDETTYNILGHNTHVFCCRSNIKILQFKSKLTTVDVWHTHPHDIVSDFTFEILNSINSKKIQYVSEDDLNMIKKYFRYQYTNPFIKSKTDEYFGFSFPDTGFTSLIMCLTRFTNNKIYVCGFDNYSNKNENIYETKSDTSIFKTPVFNQQIFYNFLIHSEQIYELT